MTGIGKRENYGFIGFGVESRGLCRRFITATKTFFFISPFVQLFDCFFYTPESFIGECTAERVSSQFHIQAAFCPRQSE